MEYFDILTEDGELTGRTGARDAVHRDGDWHRTAHLWVMVGGNELLLQKRSRTKENHPGLWDLSCAGHLDAGEEPEDGALRELKEELGLTAERDRLRFLFKRKNRFLLNNGTYIDNEWPHVFLLELTSRPDVTVDPEEVEAVDYLDWREFQRRWESGDESIVDHGEGYGMLFEVLERGFENLK